MPCQEHLVAVGAHLERLGDTAVAAIAFADPWRLADHHRRLELPFPLLADPDRTLYRRFGLGRGSVRQVWNPGTLALYGRLLRQGRRPARPTEDTRQLGGDVVIGPDGRLAAAFRPRSPDARPTIDELVAAVSAAGRAGSG
ncbi:MAG: AhpC/TSA family protein [Actinomycetota bacterium]